MNWKNWPDNLLGLYIDFESSERIISKVLYEFTNTRQQGIIEEFKWNEESQEWVRKHTDNYGNNLIYTSGITYHQMALISPLFYPVNVVDGISVGFISNRFYSHHLGVKGRLFPHLYWKGLATYVEHFGTYNVPSHDKKVLLYGEFLYRNPSFPFDLGISLAADPGDNPGDIFGAQFTLSRTW